MFHWYPKLVIGPTAVLGWGSEGGQLSPNCFKKEDVFHGKS